jgi:hypothetical protein
VSRQAVTLLQASQANPALARLMDLQQASSERLKAISLLIPSALRADIQAGPIEKGVWCLLTGSTTTAAKLRQLLPSFEAQLRTKNLPVTEIRLKVQRSR